MKQLDSFLKRTSAALGLPLDTIKPLACYEKKFSLLQKLKLRQLIESYRTQKRIHCFAEFIRRFLKCNVDLEEIYEQIVGKIIE